MYFRIISTECALKRPLTYDNIHPSHLSHPPLFGLCRPERHKMTPEELGRPPMSLDELIWTKYEL